MESWGAEERGGGGWRWQGERVEAAEGIADGCVVAGTVPTAMDADTRTHTYTHAKKKERVIEE